MENYIRKSSEEEWNDFWKEICTNEDGALKLEQIKKELSDFKFMIDNVPTVYEEVTGNRTANSMLDAKTIISLHRENINEEFKTRVEWMLADLEDDFVQQLGNSGKELVESLIKKYVEE